MSDQASPLRNLVLRETAVCAEQTRSRLVVAAGGKSGVGVTTLAVNLAVAFAQQGLRTVLLDADLQRPDAAVLCGCSLSPGLGEVLTARRDIHEVLQRGPASIQLVSGIAAGDSRAQFTPKSQQRLLRQLHSLSKHVDAVIIDSGSLPTDLARQLWAMANDVLLVTSTDVVAVMDSYAAIKTLFTPAPVAPHLRLVVNHAQDAAQATDVFRRIDQSCQRFLSVSLELIAALPADEQARQAARHGVPVLLLAQQSPLSQALEQLAGALAVAEDDLPHEQRSTSEPGRRRAA